MNLKSLRATFSFMFEFLIYNPYGTKKTKNGKKIILRTFSQIGTLNSNFVP